MNGQLVAVLHKKFFFGGGGRGEGNLFLCEYLHRISAMLKSSSNFYLSTFLSKLLSKVSVFEELICHNTCG